MKSNITTKLKFKDYEKKYKNYKKGLMSFTKKEVDDFDKQANTIGERYVLNKNRWALIGDTYYEMPKKLSCRWFKGVSASRRLLACVIPLGVVGALGGGGYGVYYLISNNNNGALIDASCRDVAEIVKDVKGVNGSRTITIKEKGDNNIVSIDVTIGDHQCIKDEYSYGKENKDDKWAITIYKETLANHKGKIVIHPNVSSKGTEVTDTEWNAALNILINITNRNFTVTETSEEQKNDASTNCIYYEKGNDEKREADSKNLTNDFTHKQGDNYYIYNDSTKKWEQKTVKKESYGFYFDRSINAEDNEIKTYLDNKKEFTFADGVYSKAKKGKDWDYVFSIKFSSDKKISSYTITKTSSETNRVISKIFSFSKYGTTTFDFPPFVPPVSTKLKIRAISPELKEQIIAEGIVTKKDSTYYYKDTEVVFDNKDSREEYYPLYLQKQLDSDKAGDVEAIDIYLTENETDYYIFKDDTYSIDVSNIEDFNYEDLYDYTIGNNTANKVMKGIGVDIEPSVFIYNRNIAKDIFGTDEPANIEKEISNIELFNTAAAKVKTKGYNILATIDDMYRMYTQHFSKNFVNDVEGKKVLNIVKEYEKFGKDAIEFYQNGYISKSINAWTDEWYNEMSDKGKTLGFIGPRWFITDQMQPHAGGSLGQWAICPAPLASFWGGSNLSISPKSDNIDLAKQFIKDMFDLTNLEKAYDKCKTPNSKKLINNYASDDTKTYDHLGKQNPYGYFASVANIAPSTVIMKDKYQGKCSDFFISAFRDGTAAGSTYNDCISDFKNRVKKEFDDVNID